jgi:exodeoxyribonuclease VII small subunit
VPKKTRDPSFEELLAELETLVATLETGDLPLDAAMQGYERGVQLTRECQAMLQAARQKVQILQQTAAGPAIAEFAPGADGAVDGPA